MDSSDRAEEARERNEGFNYDEYREQMRAPLSESAEQEDTFSETAEQEDDAYDLDDPKHETFHERYANVWDSREGK